MGNWGYNPTYRSYNPTCNWEGPTLQKVFDILDKLFDEHLQGQQGSVVLKIGHPDTMEGVDSSGR